MITLDKSIGLSKRMNVAIAMSPAWSRTAADSVAARAREHRALARPDRAGRAPGRDVDVRAGPIGPNDDNLLAFSMQLQVILLSRVRFIEIRASQSHFLCHSL